MPETKFKEIIIDEEYPQPALVLTRKIGQGARITLNGICIDAVVAQIDGKQIRLAIKAPKETARIDRVCYKKMRK